VEGWLRALLGGTFADLLMVGQVASIPLDHSRPAKIYWAAKDGRMTSLTQDQPSVHTQLGGLHEKGEHFTE